MRINQINKYCKITGVCEKCPLYKSEIYRTDCYFKMTPSKWDETQIRVLLKLDIFMKEASDEKK
jgi:hypothetical protein